jgi:hypothetical protein
VCGHVLFFVCNLITAGEKKMNQNLVAPKFSTKVAAEHSQHKITLSSLTSSTRSRRLEKKLHLSKMYLFVNSCTIQVPFQTVIFGGVQK